MKSIRRSLARLLFDRSPKTDGCCNVQHVVVIRWDAKLGDSIVSSFFYREIKKLEGTKVTVLTVDSLASMHQNDFGADRVIVTSAPPGIAELLKIRRLLGRVDAVLHLVELVQPREIFFLWLLGASEVYSLDDALRSVNRKMGYATRGLLFAEKYAWVLARLGVDLIQGDYIVPVAPLAARRDRLADKIDILFNPYASRDDKSLSLEKSCELLRCLADTFPYYTIGILSSSKNWQQAKQIEKGTMRSNIIALKGIVTPQNAAAEIQRARIVVSVDTAIVHMAVGLEKRLVAIYPPIGAGHNPWLPPVSVTTRVIFCNQDTLCYQLTGLKDMNKFSTFDIVRAVEDLVASETHHRSIVRVKAKLKPGLGVASCTLARQLPLISERFPEVSNCWPGTINLELESPLVVINPDHRTPPIAWTPSGVTTEVFDLVRIELEFSHVTFPVPAWLYIAHGSPHRKTPTVHEVITQQLDLSGISSCHILIHTDSVMI